MTDELVQNIRKAVALLLDNARQQKSGPTNSEGLYRAAFFAITRILLIRLWEDTGLIEKQPDNRYEIFNYQIEQVLKGAFRLVDDGESWLFNRENDHTWYHPDETTLQNTLEALSSFKFSNLDEDVLGTIYEEYIEQTDRKNKGQFYTPPEVISFIWNRVGLREPPDFFYSENGKQQPKLIFDPAAGSGGFLMEAARRLKISMDGNHHSLSDLLTIKNAFGSFCGSEVQAFPHYIAQVNLLIQLTPVIKQLIDTNQYDPEELSLSIINRDSLSLYNRKSTQLQNGDKISNCRDFDYVCSNPPFIGEKGNKTLFRATIKNYPYWKQYYQGKMDYLYWFVILGLSKLKEGGKLGFITTSYWFTADGATKLRQYILDHALIREIIDLGKTPVFGDAPGQHNLIFVLERSTNPRKRASNQIKTARVKKDKTGLKSLLSHLGKYIDKTHYSDEFIDVFVCPTIQGDLTPKAWNLFHHNETGKILKKIIAHSTPLGQVCYVNQGIISGADRVTQRNIKLLSANAIAMHNIKIGDGIFVLSKKELHSLHLSESERALIKPFCKNSDIERYRTNLKSQQVLIYTNKEIDIDNYPKIRAHLEKFRPILENKRECREGRLPWFSLHWPRNTGAFEGEKIITPNRAVENTFALSESPLYAMSDVFFITSRTQREKLGYILAILNSSLMDFWFSWTRKGKGGIREYVGTPLSQVPIRRIDFYSPSETAIHDRLVMLASEIATAKPEEKEVLQQEIDAATINLCGLKSIDNLL